MSHGIGGYRKGCRCEVCRAANAQEAAEYRARCRAEGRVTSHGASGSQQGCRCEECTTYARDSGRARTARRRNRPPSESQVELIFSRSVQVGDCLIYQGTDNGHGYRSLGGIYVHRIVHEAVIGPIPRGYDVDHLCFVRACVAPDHLEAVTRAENLRRARVRNGPPQRQPIAHGTTYGYQRGCRCADCRQQWSRYQRAYRERRRKRVAA